MIGEFLDISWFLFGVLNFGPAVVPIGDVLLNGGVFPHHQPFLGYSRDKRGPQCSISQQKLHFSWGKIDKSLDFFKDKVCLRRNSNGFLFSNWHQKLWNTTLWHHTSVIPCYTMLYPYCYPLNQAAPWLQPFLGPSFYRSLLWPCWRAWRWLSPTKWRCQGRGWTDCFSIYSAWWFGI